MADTNTIPGNLVVQGTLTPAKVSLPAACVGDSQVTGAITAAKLQHRHAKQYAQPNGAAVVAERKTVHVAYGATGLVLAVRARLITACSGGGTPTVTVDVLKNGTTILSAPIAIVTADGTNLKTGAITVPGLVAGDVLDVNVTVAAGGGTLGQGLFVDAVVNEDA